MEPPIVLANNVLISASISGDVDCAKRALVDGATVHRETSDESPLVAAVCHGYTEMVELLIAHGADVCAPCFFNERPLHFAAANDRAGLVRLLVKHGARVDDRDNAGATPMHAAARNRSVSRETIETLDELGASLTASTTAGLTPLYLAAHSGNATAIRALVGLGADVNAGSNAGDAPLYAAIMQFQPAAAIALIEAEADVNRALPSGETPLRAALINNMRAVVAALLARGARVREGNGAKGSMLNLVKGRRHSAKMVGMLTPALRREELALLLHWQIAMAPLELPICESVALL